MCASEAIKHRPNTARLFYAELLALQGGQMHHLFISPNVFLLARGFRCLAAQPVP
jgi:hypothetical protein